MLVTITIIGILASLVFGALQMARESAREAKTEATIAKLNSIIMRRYESYMTRRVPLSIRRDDVRGVTLTPRQAAEVRLAAIRDLMRMEMPERWNDVSDLPQYLPYTDGNTVYAYDKRLPESALHLLYRNKYQPPSASQPTPNANYSHAKCLFMIVTMGSPEVMEQFNQNEIAADTDGWQYFVDGWEKPIYFLRWAPGCSSYSDIQPADPVNNHDPFDTRKVDSAGYLLVPLIYAFGSTGSSDSNVNVTKDAHFYDPNTKTAPMSICGFAQYQTNGAPADSSAAGNITNHHIEQR